MRRISAQFALLALIVAQVAGAPASAQTAADRTQYEPLYNLSAAELQKELRTINDLSSRLEKETDLVRGCGLLNETLTHLKTTDGVLDDLIEYTDKLRRGKENEAAKAQKGTVTEQITLKEGDIARMCKDLPPS